MAYLIPIRRIVAAATLVQLILSQPLWAGDRLLPAAPVFWWLPHLPPMLEWFIYILLLVGFSFLMLYPHRTKFNLVVSGLFVAYWLWDYTRIQPYYIQFVLILGILSLYEVQEEENDRSADFTKVLGILMSFIYFWSGFYKLNGAYFEDIFPWFSNGFLGKLGFELHSPVWGIMSASLEMFSGLLLLIPATQRFGMLITIGTHVFILLCLGPLGNNWNEITWPWNVAMPIVIFLVFKQALPLHTLRFNLNIVLSLVGVVLMAGLSPALFLTGKWDSFFSFDLYAARTKHAYIYFKKEEIEKLPKTLHPYLSEEVESSNYRVLQLTKIGFKTMRTLPYPETRAFHKMHKAISLKYFNNASTGILYSQTWHDHWERTRSAN